MAKPTEAAPQMTAAELDAYLNDPIVESREYYHSQIVMPERLTAETYHAVIESALEACKKYNCPSPQQTVDRLIADMRLAATDSNVSVCLVDCPYVVDGFVNLKPLKKWMPMEEGIRETLDPNGLAAQYAKRLREHREAEVRDAQNGRRLEYLRQETQRRKEYDRDRLVEWNSAPITRAIVSLVPLATSDDRRQFLRDLARAVFIEENTAQTAGECPSHAIPILGMPEFTPYKFRG